MISAHVAAASGSRSAASSLAAFDGVKRDSYFLGLNSARRLIVREMSWRFFAHRSGKHVVEAIIFIGLPGSGKSSFYKERFFQTHVRISLDLLKTRHRERRFLELCLATDQRFVIDNMNLTRSERSGYVAAAKAKHYAVTGYYFQSKVEDCLRRNAERPDSERVPAVAIFAAAKKLELPRLDEGFATLFYVRLVNDGFAVEEWRDEV